MELGDIYNKAPGGAKKSKSVCQPVNENPLRNRRRTSRIVSEIARKFSLRDTSAERPSTRDSFVRESVAFNSALTYQDTRISAFRSRQTIADVVIDQVAEIECDIYESITGGYVFHVAWAVYIFLLSLLGGVIIYFNDDITFVDAWFNSTSATVNSGLSAISPDGHSKSSFVVLAILMFFGSAPFLLLPSMIYRCIRLRKYLPLMTNAMISDLVPPESKYIITQHQLLYDATIVTICIVWLYIILCFVFGGALLAIFLPLKALEPELKQQGFSHSDNVLFSVISAFTNSGMLMSPNSLSYVDNNPGVIIGYTFLILSGNVLMPVLLRALFVAAKSYLQWLSTPKTSIENAFSSISDSPSGAAEHAEGPNPQISRCLQAVSFAMNNPRLITTQLFLHMENMYLLQFFVLSNLLLFIIFNAVCLTNDTFADAHDPDAHTAFMGMFQNINMRHSGFAVFNFRDFPQSMLLVYAVAMFLSPVPYIGVLHASGE
jgi:Trk-type K+ transport system membrane component